VLRWQPDPIIVTERARHMASTVIDVADGGAVLADELLMLGRLDERPGAMRTSLELRRDGAPVALTGVDTGLPGWDGPGGTDGAKVVGTRVVVDPLDRVRPMTEDPSPTRSSAVLRPSGGGAIVTALADDPATALARLDAILDLGAG
jgi:urease accessory protein